jgi:hypothetical protein
MNESEHPVTYWVSLVVLHMRGYLDPIMSTLLQKLIVQSCYSSVVTQQ